jgi:hypothetical protein
LPEQGGPSGERVLAFADAGFHRQVQCTGLVDGPAKIGGELADLIEQRLPPGRNVPSGIRLPPPVGGFLLGHGHHGRDRLAEIVGHPWRSGGGRSRIDGASCRRTSAPSPSRSSEAGAVHAMTR